MTTPRTTPLATTRTTPMMARSYPRPLDAVDWVRGEPDGAGWRVTAGKTVSRDDPYQPGHYPDLTLYPAAFLIETVRQAVGRALPSDQGGWLEIQSLRNLRLLRPMLAGDELVLAIDVLPDGETLRIRASVTARDGVPVAELTVRLTRGNTEADGRPGITGRPGNTDRQGLNDCPGNRDRQGNADHPGPAGRRAPVDYRGILALLPVRHPMVLVDRVVALAPGEWIETEKAISGSEPCFAGLAEDLPASRYAYPRSLAVESLGQSSALLWLGTGPDPGEQSDWLPVAARLRDCRFFGDAYPGDVVRHTVRLHAVSAAGAAFMSGRSRVGDRLLCEVGALTAVRRPRATLLAGANR